MRFRGGRATLPGFIGGGTEVSGPVPVSGTSGSFTGATGATTGGGVTGPVVVSGGFCPKIHASGYPTARYTQIHNNHEPERWRRKFGM